MDIKEEKFDSADQVLLQHKKFINNTKMRDEAYILDLLKSITNIHESKYYYQNVKKLFPQVWKSFTKEQKQYLAHCIKAFFLNYLKFMQNQKKKINAEYDAFPNELLEILQQLEPQIVLGPEFFVKATAKNNCWVNCILTLEEQTRALPKYDKFPMILNDLYKTLEQEDYYVNKCKTGVSDKCLTFSQFHMWEEVNTEFNNSLCRICELNFDFNIDLKYSNEYDQQLWEDLYPEGIINVGDLDRLKFFNQNSGRNYGAFKAEFQKWMVLGKNQQTYQVFESNREKLCQEWTALPRFIDQVHYHKLARFQENTELNEIMALLHSCRATDKARAIKDFFTAATIQRDRVPVKCESNQIWKDILENRYIPLNILNASNESKKKTGTEQQQQQERGNKFAFKRLLNYVWDKLLIAKQSRRQNLLEVCKRFLTEAESIIVSSDKEELKGISLQKEKYLLIQEKLKLILHHFRFHVRLNLDNKDFIEVRNQLIYKGLDLSSPAELKKLRDIEDEVVSKMEVNDESSSVEGKDKVYREIWESEILRLRGEIYMQAGLFENANKSYIEAIDL